MIYILKKIDKKILKITTFPRESLPPINHFATSFLEPHEALSQRPFDVPFHSVNFIAKDSFLSLFSLTHSTKPTTTTMVSSSSLTLSQTILAQAISQGCWKVEVDEKEKIETVVKEALEWLADWVRARQRKGPTGFVEEIVELTFGDGESEAQVERKRTGENRERR